jgi:hypothetical protein
MAPGVLTSESISDQRVANLGIHRLHLNYETIIILKYVKLLPIKLKVCDIKTSDSRSSTIQ